MLDREVESAGGSIQQGVSSQQVVIVQNTKISYLNPLTGILEQTSTLSKQATQSQFILVQLKSNAQLVL